MMESLIRRSGANQPSITWQPYHQRKLTDIVTDFLPFIFQFNIISTQFIYLFVILYQEFLAPIAT